MHQFYCKTRILGEHLPFFIILSLINNNNLNTWLKIHHNPINGAMVVCILLLKDHPPFMALRVLNFKLEPSFMEILP